MSTPLSESELDLWGNLVRICYRLPTELDRALAEYGLSFAKLEILTTLARVRSGLRFSDLNETASASKARLSGHIADLCEVGLCERSPDPTDGRASILTITREGRRLLERVIPGHTEHARRLVLDHLPSSHGESALISEFIEQIRMGLGDPWTIQRFNERYASGRSVSDVS